MVGSGSGRAWIKATSIITIVFVILIILYTYPLIGLWGQVKTTSYPDDYTTLNTYLKQQNISGHVIYLPWQTYLTYNWTRNVSTDGRIANPINKVVEHIVLTGPDDYGGKTDIQEKIGRCIETKDIGCLEDESVEYIILDRCAYYPPHDWLDGSILETSCISLYRLDPVSDAPKQRIPLRFIIGSAISLIALIVSVYLLAFQDRQGKSRKKK
jgi:hypothetical protein